MPSLPPSIWITTNTRESFSGPAARARLDRNVGTAGDIATRAERCKKLRRESMEAPFRSVRSLEDELVRECTRINANKKFGGSAKGREETRRRKRRCDDVAFG